MPWSRLDLRDAIVALYLGRVKLTEISKQLGGVSRRNVTRLVSQMPAGLVDDDQRMQVTREANKLAKHEMYQCYSDWELPSALLDYSTATKSLSACSAEYGVPSSTLRAKRKSLSRLIWSSGMLRILSAACASSNLALSTRSSSSRPSNTTSSPEGSN